MSTRHPTLMIQDHVQLGNTLKEARLSLNWLMHQASLSSKLGRDALKVLLAIDNLRHSLDDRLSGQVPYDRDPRRLTPSVYFGEQQLRLRWYELDELDTDEFAPWTPGPDR
jgi:hypothetical protein